MGVIRVPKRPAGVDPTPGIRYARPGRVDETGKTRAAAAQRAGSSTRAGVPSRVGGRRARAGIVGVLVVLAVPSVVVAVAAPVHAADPRRVEPRARLPGPRAVAKPVEGPGRASLLAALPPATTNAFAPPSFGVAGLVLAPPPSPPTQPASDEPEQPRGVEERKRTSEPAARSVLLRKRSGPPFWIDREFDTHRTRAMPLPPLFVHRQPKPGHPEKLLHLNLALTFGWANEDGSKKRWLSLPALFFGTFSERKTLWGTVPLLMGYRRVGEQFNFGQFPLVW